MRIQGRTITNDKIQSGVEVRFGRVLRFDVGGVVYEFNPMKESKLTPRLEAVVNCKPQIEGGMRTDTPGFSAKLTIYNPGADLFSLVQNNTALFANKSKLENALSNKTAITNINRPRVNVYAGYWDYENKKEEVTQIFSGYLNSSSYYRKGVDTIMELWCHNIKLSVDDFARTIPYSGSGESRVEQILANRANVSKDTSYLSTVKTLIKDIAETRSPRPTISGAAFLDRLDLFNKNQDSQQKNPPLTEEEKNSTGWIKLNFIIGAYVDSKTEYNADRTLAMAFNSGIPKNFTYYKGERSDVTLEQQIRNLLKNFPGGAVSFKREDDVRDGSFNWFFWYVGGAGGSFNSTVEKTRTIVLEDFQNFLEAPVCNGNGQIVMKMLFNPQIIPMHNIMLTWDQYKTGNILNLGDKVQGGQVNAAMAYYSPLIQSGRYSSVVYALTQSSNGDIFNVPMKVVGVVHDLSTTTSKWNTTVTTSGLDFSQVKSK